jgi:hypothetical protein
MQVAVQWTASSGPHKLPGSMTSSFISQTSWHQQARKSRLALGSVRTSCSICSSKFSLFFRCSNHQHANQHHADSYASK